MTKFRSSHLLTLGAGLLLAAASSAGAVGAAAGSTIANTALFEYTSDAGATEQIATTPVTLSVQQVGAVSVSPDGTVTAPGQTVYAAPGDSGVLTYTVTNTGNGPDSITLSNSGSNGVGTAYGDVTYYLDNGNGVYDAGDTQITGALPLAADATATVFVVKPISAAAPASQQTLVNLIATAGVGGAADSNNVGRITAQNIIAFTLADDHALQVTTPGTVTATHTLTNTGNASIDPATLVASTTLSGAAGVSASYVVTNPDATSTASFPTLQGALAAAQPLAAAQAYTITVTYTAASGLSAGGVTTAVLSVYSNVADSAAVENTQDSAAAVSDTDTVTVVAGNATVTKTAQSCGTDATCAAPGAATTIRPGDYVLYTVSVRNDGTAALKFPTLRDYVPVNTTFVSVSGATNTTHTVLYSLNRSSWTSFAPTALATSTSATSGPFVYVGLDSAANGSVGTADVLAPGQTLTMRLIVQVRNTGTSN